MVISLTETQMGNIENWYTTLNTAADIIHKNDSSHPVATAHGELPDINALSLCPNVDVWGMNVYRWDNPEDIFTEWSVVSSKPMYLSEAFLIDESSPFDTGTIKEALGLLKARESSHAETGKFVLRPDNVIKWVRDFKLNPVDEYPFKRDDTEGCWVIYQQPVST